jgi:hypothetical protein
MFPALVLVELAMYNQCVGGTEMFPPYIGGTDMFPPLLMEMQQAELI